MKKSECAALRRIHFFSFIIVGSAFSKSHRLDKAACSFGEGIALCQRFPEVLAVVAVQAVDHLVGDDIVDYPTRPTPDLITDADVAVSGAAVGAAPKLCVHVPYPTDSLPLDLTPEIFLVDIFSALLEFGVGAALGQLILFLELSRYLVE